MEFLGRVQQFFREVAAEFRRVTWPARADVTNSTVVVLVLVFILAFYLWAVDVGLSFPIERLLRWGGRS
jgi:preprotein translocase subunit SecE